MKPYTLKDIDLKTKEGQVLFGALLLLSVSTFSNLHVDEIIQECEKAFVNSFSEKLKSGGEDNETKGTLTNDYK